jgi:putative DNA primase/helicase
MSEFRSRRSGLTMATAREIARALGGDVIPPNRVLAPGPGHSAEDRSLSILITGSDFVVHSFSGDDWRIAKDYVRARLGLEPFAPARRS